MFYAVDRILRQQKEARAAVESKAKENQNTVQPLLPSVLGINQLPNSDSHGIPPQHEPSQATDNLGITPNSSTSIANTFQNLRRKMGLTASGQGSMNSIPSPPETFPSNLGNPENSSVVEPKPHTPSAISKISSPGGSLNANPAVTPLSHICAFIQVIGHAFIA